MAKWFRCPICGRNCLERNIGNDYPIEVFNQVGLGRAKGFRYDPIMDLGIIERIKSRIKFLYNRFFDPVFPSILLTPRIRVSASILANPEILIMPVVRKHG